MSPIKVKFLKRKPSIRTQASPDSSPIPTPTSPTSVQVSSFVPVLVDESSAEGGEGGGSRRPPSSSTSSPRLATASSPLNVSHLITDPLNVSLHDIFVNPSLSPVLLPVFHECAALHMMAEVPLFYVEYLKVRQAQVPGYIPSVLQPVVAPGGASGLDPRRSSAPTDVNTITDLHGVASPVVHRPPPLSLSSSSSSPSSPDTGLPPPSPSPTATTPIPGPRPGAGTAMGTRADVAATANTVASTTLDVDTVSHLLRTYVDPESPSSLNLSGSLRTTMLKAGVHGVTLGHLDLMGKEMGRVMQNNLLPVFRTYLTDQVANDLKRNMLILPSLSSSPSSPSLPVSNNNIYGLNLGNSKTTTVTTTTTTTKADLIPSHIKPGVSL